MILRLLYISCNFFLSFIASLSQIHPKTKNCSDKFIWSLSELSPKFILGIFENHHRHNFILRSSLVYFSEVYPKIILGTYENRA